MGFEATRAESSGLGNGDSQMRASFKDTDMQII